MPHVANHQQSTVTFPWKGDHLNWYWEDQQSPQRGSTVDCLRGNHWSPRMDSVNHPQRRLPFHMKMKVDCWSSLRQSLIPQRRFADFEQKLLSTSACLASQRTFPLGKSKNGYMSYVECRLLPINAMVLVCISQLHFTQVKHQSRLIAACM